MPQGNGAPREGRDASGRPAATTSILKGWRRSRKAALEKAFGL
jgi:hypothetical protein